MRPTAPGSSSVPGTPWHVFTGQVGKEPVLFPANTSERIRGCYHVVCADSEGNAPIKVALTQAGVVGGDRVDPGTSIDLVGDGVWIVGPKDGNLADVSIERRFQPSHRSISPLGEYQAITTYKSDGVGVDLLAGHWHAIVTNILGAISMHVLVMGSGPPAWIGTHMDVRPDPASPTKWSGPPPEQQDLANVGGAAPLLHGQLREIPGNPLLFAFAYQPGVVLYCWKVCRGRAFAGS